MFRIISILVRPFFVLVGLVFSLLARGSFWVFISSFWVWVLFMEYAASAVIKFTSIQAEINVALIVIPPVIFTLVVRGLRKGFGRVEKSEKQNDDQAMEVLGSADWRTDFSSCETGAAGEKGTYALPFGRNKLNGQLVRKNIEGHVLTYGATRSGKGVGCVVPALLDRAGSVVVIDPKSELYHMTARQRKRLGSTPRALDPFALLGDDARRAKINPISHIRADSNSCVDDARRVARQIIPAGSGGGGDSNASHFDDSARELLSGLILHAATSPEWGERNLPHVRDLLSQSSDDWEKTLKEMSERTDAGGQIAAVANRFSRVPSKEAGSIISTANRETAFLDSAGMREHLTPGRGEGVDMSTLREDAQSLFINLPPHLISDYKGYLRLIVGGAIDALSRARGKEKVLFLLDEVAQLGKMKSLEKAASILAGYGGQLWFLFQSRGQLENLYGEDEAISGNCEISQFMGVAPTDSKTAEVASEACGETTVIVNSGGETKGIGGSPGELLKRKNEGSSENWSLQKRQLIHPDEIQRLGNDLLMMETQEQPAKLEKIRFFDAPEYHGKHDANPMRA